jgi:hypothetical protein
LLIVVIVKANTNTTWNELLGKHCGLTSDHNATFAECQGDNLRRTCGGSRRHFPTSAEFRRIIRSWDFEGVWRKRKQRDYTGRKPQRLTSETQNRMNMF